MEAEGPMMSSFNDDASTNKSFSRHHPSKSRFSDDTTSSDARRASKPCFDCSICLDFVVDPVVTLCGHLYCWSCIYKWLQVDTPNHDCPVCKTPLSHNSLVPLHGRGTINENIQVDRKVTEIPNRLARSRNVRRSPRMQHDYYHPSRWGEMGVFNSTAGGVLWDLVTAILPLVLRNGNNRGGEELNFWRMNRVTMVRSSERERRVENSLHQIWMLMVCCSVLWWLFS